jgi:hypothetical protein
MMKKILIISLFLAIALSQTVFDGKALGQNAADEEQIYKFPEILPSIDLWGGYRFIGLSGSGSADEYEYLHNSFSFGGKIIAFPFPHRIHLDFTSISRYDFLGDASYAYKDMVLFRGTARSMFHNLDNFTLVDLDPSTTNPGISRFDASETFGVRAGIHSLFLRLKTPDYPLHFYIDARFTDKDGNKQQRFLGGSGWFSGIDRASQGRGVNWDSKDITLGANTHFGPVEMDYSHTEKRLRSSDDGVLDFAYSGAGFPSGSLRQAGVFPHNLIPDTEGSTNTVKLHTSYTGKLVASTTFSWTERENNASNAKADYFTGAGEFMWTPITRLLVTFKYRHRELDFANPDALPAGYLGYSSFASELTGIRDSISSKVDTLSGYVKYMFGGASVGAGYTFKNTERENAESWGLKEQTEVNTFALDATARLPMNIRLKARYRHVEADDPAYNIQPDSSDSGLFSVSWTPLKRVSAFLYYNIASEERDGVRYANLLPTSDVQGRETDRSRFTGSLTFLITDELSLSSSYSYWRNKVRQDLVYNSESPPAEFVDHDVMYKDAAHNYFAALNYMPKQNISLGAEVSHTKSKGAFYPNIAEGLQPVSIASFSELQIKETVYSVYGNYGIKGGWDIGLRYKYSQYDDLIDNPDNPEVKDGNARIVLLTITKRW